MLTALMAYARIAKDCSRHLCKQRSRIKGPAALWVTNGCTSMSKPITTKSTPMCVDNEKVSDPLCLKEINAAIKRDVRKIRDLVLFIYLFFITNYIF